MQLEVVEGVLNHLSGSKAGIVGALDYQDEKRSALEHEHCSECSSPSAQPSSSRVGRDRIAGLPSILRSEEHTSELQSLMRISYAVFCLKKKQNRITST